MDTLVAVFSYIKEAFLFASDLSTASTAALVIAVILFGFALRYGKDRITSLILSLYIGLITYVHFPYSERFLISTRSETHILFSNAIIFAAFVLLSYVVVDRIVWAEYPNKKIRRLFEAFLLALSAALLLVAFSYNILPVASFYPFAEPIDLLFSSSDFFFWWLIFPLFAILFLSKR